MYVKNDGQLESIKRNELTSGSTTILHHIESETGTEDVYRCPTESLNYYHLRKLFSSAIYIPSDIFCWNKNFFFQVTLTLLSIGNQQQIIVSINFNKLTEEITVIMESTDEEQKSTIICTLDHPITHSFKNPPPVVIKCQDGKFWMTNIFFVINDKIYFMKCLTYIDTTKSYTTDKEEPATWDNSSSSCPPESTNFAFIETFLQEPALNRKCEHILNHLKNFHITYNLNEPNGNYSKSTWWQKDAFER